MPGPLLQTKFFVPRRRGAMVPRARLSQRLVGSCEAKLTLVAAPAGFGKTTLLADWLAAVPPDGATVAWLSLDQSYDDPASFWTYLITALQTVAPEVGADALALLQSPRPPPIETVLATVLNELGAIRSDVVLVLDDYHLLEAHEIHAGMAYLLDHLPPRMHLVIASRADPPLPLARLRVRGELVEVRAADLRFTADEAAAYLNDVMGLHLSATDVAALEDRTEGWIAALQLAGLSMQGRDDVGGFIAGFAGDDRYILDYLVEEVLQRQPEAVRSFLLQTSILDRLSAPLCDAVTGEHSGKAVLEALERGNLFVLPLDDSRRWYRYHHLFADMLRTHLLDEEPDLVSALHRRASEWHAGNGEPSDAIRHALAARDFGRAADLVELAASAVLRNRQEATLLGWLKALPDQLLRNRPVLSDIYAGALLSNGHFDGVEPRLRDVERWLDVSSDLARSAAIVVVDEEGYRRLSGTVALHRAAYALALGDVAQTVVHARRALGLIAEDDHLWRGAAGALLGLASWATGDLESAHRSYADGTLSLQRAGHISDVLGCAITLADIRIAQGRLHDAKRTYEEALQLATANGPPALRGTADMHVGLSQLERERDNLEAATQHVLRSQELGEHNGLPQNPYRWRVAMARIRDAEGDLDGALELLDQAERLYTSDFGPHVRPIAAMKARVLVRQGRLGEALAWARGQGMSVEDELSYVREFEHLTLARVLLARGSGLESLGFLERLLQAAEDGRRTGSVIEILVLQALAQQTRGNMPAALVPLERALSLAEPEEYIRTFVDEGPPMAALLDAAVKHGILLSYVRRLLARSREAQDTPPAKQGLSEPLSERELDVLRLLATDLDGPEIARELTVSLSTMRTHTRSIFNKLGVSSRRAAVRRGEELDLLSRTRKH
ncbi:MAG: LuxR C-terminal-related transcriptional regulator [Chloroflexota bacterium]|nr:LuxR C-terminal-related transcriptional regulator [Chloroflexota bacterium]